MTDEPTAAQDRLAELRSSAKGWHGVQLAALGFIGLCGVLKTDAGADPWALQLIAGFLVLAAFVVACLGIMQVGRAAWPLYGPEPPPAARADQLAVERASRQLTSGLALTFCSIALLAGATATAWVPRGDDGGDAPTAVVQVQTSAGQSACGSIADAPSGTLRVVTASQPIDVSLDAVASVRPVDSC